MVRAPGRRSSWTHQRLLIGRGTESEYPLHPQLSTLTPPADESALSAAPPTSVRAVASRSLSLSGFTQGTRAHRPSSVPEGRSAFKWMCVLVESHHNIIHVETAVRLFKDDVMMISAFRGTDPTRDGAMTQHSITHVVHVVE